MGTRIGHKTGKKQVELEEAFIDKIQNIIRENLDNRSFSTEFLCDELHMSRSQLHRRVKQHTGLSTSLFIRRIRLERGKELLETTDYNVSEIAYLTGIDSPQNFSKYFAEEYGVTPSVYRKTRENDLKVAVTGDEPSPVPLIDVGKIENRRRPDLKKYLYFSFFAVTLLLSLLLIFTPEDPEQETEKDHHTLPQPFENSIAVLPFVNFGSETTPFFMDGIVEDILTNLAYFQNLKVISRTSSMTYKNTTKGIKEIAEELKVAYLLEGSVRQIDDEVKITAQLIRATDDYHVWAKNYTRKLKDVFQLQSEISLDIAEALNQRITEQVSQMITPKSSQDFKAYNEFLVGRDLLMSRTEESIRESIRRFDYALTIDPDFTKAMASKASAYQLLANMKYKDRQENNAIAQELALNTIELDPTNGLAYATLGSIYRDQHQWKQAEAAYEIALKYNPNDAVANYWYSLLLREIGQMSRAVEFSFRATELDPLHPVIHAGHIVNCAFAGNRKLADQSIKDGRLRFESAFVYHWALAKYRDYLQDYEGALRMYDKVIEMNPDIPTVWRSRAFCLGRLGYQEEVMTYINAHMRDVPEDYLDRALAYCGLKDVTNSILCLQTAAKAGWIPTDLKVDNRYDILRDHPEFLKILYDFGLGGPENTDRQVIDTNVLH